MTPAVVSSVKPRPVGQRRAEESFLSAQQTIGPIERGMALFAMTRGQFSMLDCVIHALNEIGASSLSIWTWAIGDHEVEAVCGVLARRELRYARLMVDSSA